jgi:hypothetical protein
MAEFAQEKTNKAANAERLEVEEAVMRVVLQEDQRWMHCVHRRP